MTRKEVMALIMEMEEKGLFDVHVDPVNMDNVIKVDENFHYINKPLKERLRLFFERLFIVKPFIFYINKKFGTKVYGRKNLKGIKNAVLTCNHVDMFDCLAATKAVKGHKLFITAASFNNQRGFLGEMMRAGNMMPLSATHKGMRNFNEGIKHHLSNSHYVLFYPEQAMWWHYEKPRPFKNGAFHYAVKHNVPVIPLFITFKETKKKDKEGIPIKKFNLYIMEPIYPKSELSKNENIEYIKKLAYDMCVKKYEDFYQKKLVYNCKDKETLGN